MTKPQRRRIDLIQDPEFSTGLEDTSIGELRHRRHICSDLDVELSYYRRLLQGRLDLLAFEVRRRAGEEQRSLLEALPEILASWSSAEPGLPGRRVAIEVPKIPAQGRRAVDLALGDAFLAALPDMDDAALASVQQRLAEVEGEISRERRVVFEVSDRIQAELVRRYRRGVQSGDAAPQG